jgi:hypothetical protein
MRKTAIVDDDFPEMIHRFDTQLAAAEKYLATTTPSKSPSQKYRIYSGRFDGEERVYKEFDADGDDAAQLEFFRIASEPSCAWDLMKLVCIETAEVVRRVAENGNLKRIINS